METELACGSPGTVNHTRSGAEGTVAGVERVRDCAQEVRQMGSRRGNDRASPRSDEEGMQPGSCSAVGAVHRS